MRNDQPGTANRRASTKTSMTDEREYNSDEAADVTVEHSQNATDNEIVLAENSKQGN